MPTVAELVTRAKRRSDMENSDFISPEEWIQYISDSYADLYDLLVTKFEDYFITGPITETVSGGSNTFSLPADFYKLRGIDKDIGGDWRDVKRFNFNERNAVTTGEVSGTYRYWYVPTAAVLTQTSDQIQVYGWDRWIVADAARKALLKEDSDTSAIERELVALEAKINVAAQNRDVGEAMRVTDVTYQRDIDVPGVRYSIIGTKIQLIPWDEGFRRRVF